MYDLAVSFAAFSYVVSVNFLVLVLAVVFFIAPFSMVYHLGLSCFPFLGYLTPSCVCFLNYFKEGEETFI